MTAFTSSDSKYEEALKLGAHKVVNTREPGAGAPENGHTLNFVLSTVNATLDWQSYIQSLAPKGRFVTVGIVDRPDPAGSVSADRWTEILRWFAPWQPCDDRKNDRILRSPFNFTGNRKLQAVGRKRGIRSSAGRQGSLPDRVNK